MIDKSSSLDAMLRRHRAAFGYAENRLLSQGEYRLLAERLLSQAIRSRYFDGFIQGGLAGMTCYWASEYRHDGGVYNLAWAILSAVLVAVGIPLAIKQHRQRMAVIEALKQAADAGHGTGTP